MCGNFQQQTFPFRSLNLNAKRIINDSLKRKTEQEINPREIFSDGNKERKKSLGKIFRCKHSLGRRVTRALTAGSAGGNIATCQPLRWLVVEEEGEEESKFAIVIIIISWLLRRRLKLLRLQNCHLLIWKSKSLFGESWSLKSNLLAQGKNLNIWRSILVSNRQRKYLLIRLTKACNLISKVWESMCSIVRMLMSETF